MVDSSTLEQLLAQGQDTALLRYSLGNAYWQKREYEHAVEHLSQAVVKDPEYSAAWKLLGRCLAASQHYEQAAETFKKGIDVAQKRGDIQAAREMGVFLRRLQDQPD